MKIKLTHEELNILINNLQYSEKITFNTVLESKISGYILKAFLKSLMKKSMDLKSKYAIAVDETTLLVLNHVLPQIYPDEIYERTIIQMLMTKINQVCLSI